MTPAVIFDCDGVLADTERDSHLVAFNQTFREFGFPLQWTDAEYAHLLRIGGGKERLRTLPHEHPELHLPKDHVELDNLIAAMHRRKTEIYVALVGSGIPGRPGIRRLIERALLEGWTVAIASTSAQASVDSVLRAVIGSELASQIHGVFAGDVVAAKKPAPDIYLLALDQLDVGVADTIVIEDSFAGATAAARAGLTHLVTVSAYTGSDDFPDAAAVVSDLGDPMRPARLIAGTIELDRGMVTLDSLEGLLRTPKPIK